MSSQAQTNIINLAVKMGKIELAVKLSIIANLESSSYGGFFLKNAEADSGLSPHQFASGLSALEAKGMYKPADESLRGHYGYFMNTKFFLVTYNSTKYNKIKKMHIPAKSLEDAYIKFAEYFEEESSPVPHIISVVKD